MKDTDVVYIGIDLHSKTSTIGYMNHRGEYLGQQRVQTTATNLINQVVADGFQSKNTVMPLSETQRTTQRNSAKNRT